ncbi:MAG: hydroxymethylpyrimidine/phosphomethylpyrimidine kinase [Gammaproteobacteria bacterium]|nr:hydroxymethylpyrimidine/phosphomethylpyrimidine kinase [Gammaproteobacteria bacterium]
MSHQIKSPPAVLAFSGLDPTGGAGIQADIEAIASMGCHCLPVITALTVQNSQNVIRYETVDSNLFEEQARTVLQDIPVKAIKIGMLGSVDLIQALHGILKDHPNIPVVLDPIISAGGGKTLSASETLKAMQELLIPMTTIITPNSEEARLLAREADTLDACAEQLQDMGCEYVLITGTHEDTPAVTNSLYGNHRLLESFNWDRLAQTYHGSGCTLAACISAMLAHGLDPFNAVHEAQEYTWQSLSEGYQLGKGQYFPNRFYWSRGDEH